MYDGNKNGFVVPVVTYSDTKILSGSRNNIWWKEKDFGAPGIMYDYNKKAFETSGVTYEGRKNYFKAPGIMYDCSKKDFETPGVTYDGRNKALGIVFWVWRGMRRYRSGVWYSFEEGMRLKGAEVFEEFPKGFVTQLANSLAFEV